MRSKLSPIATLVAAIGVLFWLAAAPAYAVSGQTRVIAVTGDPAPDGNGMFSTFSAPVINDLGLVAFHADLVNTSGGSSDNAGIFLGGVATLLQIARRGQTAPDGNGSLSVFNSSSLTLNELGQAAFVVALSDTSNGDIDNGAIYRGDGVSLVQIARTGQSPPNGIGAYSNFYSASMDNTPSLNDEGRISFWAQLAGGVIGNDQGIFVADGTSHVQIARAEDSAPDGNGRVLNFHGQTQNNIGQIAYWANFSGTSGGTNDASGVFITDGTTTTQLLRRGDLAPDGNGIVRGLSTPALNQAGQVAFTASLNGTSGGTNDDRILLRSDGATLVQLAREGDSSPDGIGNFESISRTTLNDTGQATFWASLTGSGYGTETNEGIFRVDDHTFIALARSGQTAPGGNDHITALLLSPRTALNDAGHAVSYVWFRNPVDVGAGEYGLFLFDDVIGSHKIVRYGDAFLGSEITYLRFWGGEGSVDGHGGINRKGVTRVAFTFLLADGRSGVATWSLVPEPSSVAMVACGILLVVSTRRRRARKESMGPPI